MVITSYASMTMVNFCMVGRCKIFQSSWYDWNMFVLPATVSDSSSFSFLNIVIIAATTKKIIPQKYKYPIREWY